MRRQGGLEYATNKLEQCRSLKGWATPCILWVVQVVGPVLRAPAPVTRQAIKAGASAGIPSGRVVRGTRENKSHAWHLVGVDLVEIAIEVCDGRPSDLDHDLGYWADTVTRYCPWSVVPIRLRWV